MAAVGKTEKVVRVVVAAAVIGCIVAAVSVPLGAKGAAPITKFLGRFHILALHVPIGILVLALAGEAATFFRRGRRMGDVVVGFALPLLVLTGFAAVVLGLMLGHSGHYPQRLVAPHRNLTVIGISLAGVARLLWAKRKNRWLHRGLLGASAAAMMIGAHFGGSMTHGEDYLFAALGETTPAIVEEDAGAAPVIVESDAGSHENVVVVAMEAGVPPDASVASSSPAPVDAGPPKPSNKQLAQAVINRKCAPCHTTGQKGGLRLADVSKPTKKNVLTPGNLNASSMYTNLLLPKDDDDHMPPENEAQLTAGEIATIRNFVTDPTK